MNGNKGVVRACVRLMRGFVLLNILVMTGCATYGDLKDSHEDTQASVQSLKKEMRDQDQELRREIKSLAKKVQAQENKNQDYKELYEKAQKENAELRASILGVTGTIQAFLSAEKRHYEEGLRWVDNAEKTVGKRTAELSGGSPPPSAAPPPSATPPPTAAPPPSAAPPPTGAPPPPAAPPSTAPPPSKSPSIVEKAVVIAPPPTEEASADPLPSEMPTIEILELEITPAKVVRIQR